MENIIIWAVLIIGCLIALSFVIYKIIKIIKMTPEERKQQIITYLQGSIALIEGAIDEEHEKEKLSEIESCLYERAPWLIKILFKITGRDSLQELIEMVLKEAKEKLTK